MATAVQSFSSLLRQQIEESLAGRGGARLALAPRLVRDGFDTGYQTLDAVLHGGLPVAGTTEIVGGRSSGRATIAAAYLAERTREGHVCAWVDVSGDMSPEAAAADGMDLQRVLWVRCGSGEVHPRSAECAEASEGTQNGLRVVSYARDKTVGTPGRVNRPLSEAHAVQVSKDRLPKRRGELVLQRRVEACPPPQTVRPSEMGHPKGVAKRPWGRLEQAVKAVDLLVQAGGFGAIVLDMGGIGAEFARKIPLATWFRWRAALERTRTSLVVLSPLASTGSQLGCAGSSAELVLRVEAELPEPGTVMRGGSYRLEVVRRRFADSASGSPASMEGRRKQPGRATAWESRAAWVSS